MAESSYEALLEVLEALQALDVPYMLVGSFSSNYYSYPRASNDADIVLQYSAGVLGRIRQRLDDNYLLDRQSSFETITGSVRNVLTFKPTKFDIELFRLSDDGHHQQRFSRRRAVEVPVLGASAVLPSPEDVIIQKLRWQREKDIDDARKVMQVQFARLDWDYIRRWTDEHSTTDLLHRLRAEADGEI